MGRFPKLNMKYVPYTRSRAILSCLCTVRMTSVALGEEGGGGGGWGGPKLRNDSTIKFKATGYRKFRTQMYTVNAIFVSVPEIVGQDCSFG